MRYDLQGAFLVQRLANRTSELGDLPLIRLLVANAGGGNKQWRPVVDQLLAKVGSPDRVVAVAGLGQSWEPTRQAIKRLAAARIPMIASRLTADDLSGIGMVRVAPTNSDQVKAAVAYLKRDPKVGRVLLIQDGDLTDLYATTLGDAFTREFPSLLKPVEKFNGSLPGVDTTFVQMMPSICQQRPDVVFFAGRGPNLEAFIAALPRRPCPDLPIDIMTGDDAATWRSQSWETDSNPG